MSEKHDGRQPNRLIHQTSPYLLQHAHNPVDWYPWGPEALERAREENRLILLSIGYSTCHWCHVMERESFEDPAIAELMNEHFVNIKVDREERPDLDEIYMAATQLLNHGHGGWPMTVFLTPDLEPVFAGTYFPPEDRHGRPGFPTVLHHLAASWQQNAVGMRRSAAQIVEHLSAQVQPGTDLAVGEDELRLALEQYASSFDPVHGGFGAAPKFPPATGLSLLLRLHRRFDDDQALAMVCKTLDAMAQGGIYDQVGGGFARYATDDRWLVPHFEKMLYDNALLAAVYLEAFQVTGDAFYRRIAGEVLDDVLREMTAPGGGFYTATDADSEGEEGKFFVWTPPQVVAVLGEEDGALFNRIFNVVPEGHLEGRSIPHLTRPLAATADELGVDPEALERRVDELRRKLYEARAERVPPGLDDKILTAWNALMIHALAEGSRVLDEPSYLAAARRAADFLERRLRREDGGLWRTYRQDERGEGKAHIDAYLEDYAFLADALISLYEAGGETLYLRRAEALAERMIRDFAAPEGDFFSTATAHEKLPLRYRDGSDGALPSANAVAASALARLAHHLERDDFRQAAAAALRAHGAMIRRFPRGFAKSLCVLDFLLEGPLELILTGDASSTAHREMRRILGRTYLPNRVIALAPPGAEAAPDLPLLRERPSSGPATFYLCHDATCRAPVTEPAEVERLLGELRPAERQQRLTDKVPGRATAAATARFLEPFDLEPATLGSTGLSCARLGFGGYRVDDAQPIFRRALEAALDAGVNLIDTSTNYTDGGSERLIGSVLRRRIQAGDLARDEVIVVSKIGYVQGSNYALAQQREVEERPFPEMVKIQAGLWHCLHPEFLADQLTRSLDRLELDTLDVCLLHNPEYFLTAAARRGTELQEARTEFDRRLLAAFVHLEGEVEAGRLGCYGVSSNTIAMPPDTSEATSLRRMLELARQAGGDAHHFRVLQLPFNLFESRAFLARDEGDPTVLETARRADLGVLVNRPLNALIGDRLWRLADPPIEDGEALDFTAELEQVGELESDFERRIAPLLDGRERGQISGFFSWAERLPDLRRGLETWLDAQSVVGEFRHHAHRIDAVLGARLSAADAERWQRWRGRYFPLLERLLAEVGRDAARRSRRRNEPLHERLNQRLPAEARELGLAEKSLLVTLSVPGISCTLCGIRRLEYVDGARQVLSSPRLSETDVTELLRVMEELARV